MLSIRGIYFFAYPVRVALLYFFDDLFDFFILSDVSRAARFFVAPTAVFWRK